MGRQSEPPQGWNPAARGRDGPGPEASRSFPGVCASCVSWGGRMPPQRGVAGRDARRGRGGGQGGPPRMAGPRPAGAWAGKGDSPEPGGRRGIIRVSDCGRQPADRNRGEDASNASGRSDERRAEGETRGTGKVLRRRGRKRRGGTVGTAAEGGKAADVAGVSFPVRAMRARGSGGNATTCVNASEPTRPTGGTASGGVLGTSWESGKALVLRKL